MQNRTGLNDSDYIFITIALWMSTAALMVTALTLPMLPDRIFLFKSTSELTAFLSSKYNNLLSVLMSVIPAVVIIVAASLKKRRKIVRNFASIMLFSVVLSFCFGGIVLYGISRQVAANETRPVDINTLIALAICLLMSVTSSVLPKLFHSPQQRARASKRSVKVIFFFTVLDAHWNVGAYGYLVAGLFASFMVSFFSYIPLAAFAVFHLVYLIVRTRMNIKSSVEAMVYDTLD